MMASIFKIEEQFIEAIRKNRMKFMEQFVMGRAKKEGPKYSERIYVDKKFDSLTGQEAQDMCK